MFAEDIEVADLRARWLPLVAEVLWVRANDAARPDLVPLSDHQRADQVNVWADHAVAADLHRTVDDDVRSDANVRPHVGFRGDDGGGMDLCRGSDGHGCPFRGWAPSNFLRRRNRTSPQRKQGVRLRPYLRCGLVLSRWYCILTFETHTRLVMADVTREQLFAYLDDALEDPETARIEKLLRTSADLRSQLSKVRDERDRGEHSLGAVWRRDRLSCLTREQLSGYLHGVLDADFYNYVDFHVKTIACPSCLANLDDLREKQTEQTAQSRRRKRYFETSARLLNERKK